ncbi:MAG: ABC transporter ATP-binding protein [Chlorobi bacterium]|nr:ABC transporter ATP-binding protein [Chlorobiota bacterium]
MIEAKDLLKRYGDFRLEIPELFIPGGQSFGLVGNNGAGKTTFFNLLLDLVPPDRGEIRIDGIPVNRSEEWKKFTSAYLDDSFLIPYLTPDEYFDFLARLRGVSPEEKEEVLALFDGFFDGRIRGTDKYIRDLSQGNRKKTGIAGAFIGKPKVVVLDEPFANLDPSSQIRLKQLLNRFRRDPEITLLLSSHNLEHITGVTDRIALLDNGNIVKDMTVDESTLEDLMRFFEEKIRVNEVQDGH